MVERVRITDVSPRDGLQNEPGAISTADKLKLVELLCVSGVDEVEVTSFVSARWVPQLGDAAELLRGIASVGLLSPAREDRGGGESAGWRPVLSALVPNDKGMDAAAALIGEGVPLGKLSVFTAASEAFCQRNINADIAQSLERFVPVIARCKALGVPVRGYVSCVIACPFEGPIAPAQVASVCERLAALGVDEIDLGDTIGAGTPEMTSAMLSAVVGALGPRWLTPLRLTLHLHDTFGQASACVRAALAAGVRSFDSSVAGLGGCPYASVPARRAPGNIATALLVRTLREEGFAPGLSADVDDGALEEAGVFAAGVVARARVAASQSSAGGTS